MAAARLEVHDRASALFDEAEKAAGSVAERAEVAEAAVKAGYLERAATIVLSITSYGDHLREFVELAGRSGQAMLSCSSHAR